MSDNPYAAPKAPLTPDSDHSFELTLASIFIRFVARVIDVTLATAVLLFSVLVLPDFTGANGLATSDGNPDAELNRHIHLIRYLLGWGMFTWNSTIESLLYMCIVFLFQGYLLARYGQTIGIYLAGIKIVDAATEQKPSLTRTFIIRECGMELLAFIPILTVVDALSIFGKARRCIHDYWSSTIVVNAR